MEVVEGWGEALGGNDRLLVGSVHLSLHSRSSLESLLGDLLGLGPNLFDIAAHDLVATREAVVSREVLVDASRL